MKKGILTTIAFSSLFSATQFTNKCLAISYQYENPLSHNTLTSFMEGLLNSIQGVVSWLAIIFIVIGGVMYLTAGGKDSQITLAKNTIISALIGFALAVAGPSLLKEIKDIILGATTSPLNIDNAKSIADILKDTLNFALNLIGLLALLSFIYSGFVYLGSGGDRTKTENAKKIALYSIISLSISGASLIILKSIISLLTNA